MDIINEIEEHIYYLFRSKIRGKMVYTLLDYLKALNYPAEQIMKAYNNLVSDGLIDGEIYTGDILSETSHIKKRG